MTAETFTEGELHELCNAAWICLQSALDGGDPQFVEAKFGSLSNLYHACQKICRQRSGGVDPAWLVNLGERVTLLREWQARNPYAARAVSTMIRSGQAAGVDGIRQFHVGAGK